MYCSRHPNEPAKCGHMALCSQCRASLPFDCDCARGKPVPNILKVLREEGAKHCIVVVDLKKEPEKARCECKEEHILDASEVIPPLIKPPPLIVEEETKTLGQIEIETMIAELQKKKDEEEAAKNFELEILKQELKQKTELIEKLQTQFGSIHDETERAYLKGKLEESEKLLRILEEDKSINQRVKTQYREEAKDNLKVDDADLTKMMNQLDELPKCLTDHEHKRDSTDSRLDVIDEEPAKKKDVKKKKKLKKYGTMDRLEKMYLEGLKKQRDKRVNGGSQ